MTPVDPEVREKPETEERNVQINPDEVDTKLKSLSVNDAASSNNANLTDSKLMQLLKGGNETQKAHKFWNTQPVRKDDADNASKSIAPVEKEKNIADIRQEPFNLPAGFEWVVLEVDDDKVLKEMYELLAGNYVEDDDNMFRFDYSPEFLKWALRPPGYFKDWIIGVRQTSSGTLLAMITGIPAKVHVHDSVMNMAEINFLCVHKLLRAKRLAPVLIKEVTRRVNLTGRWQAVYTAGVEIPTPMARCRYYHRSINPAKLVAINFTGLGQNMTIKRLQRLYKLPEQTTIAGIRKMENKDVPQVAKLLKEYLKKFKTWIEWDQEEVAHWMLERPNVVNSFVVARPDGKVTDFLSYYFIPSTVIGHEKYKSMIAAYSFYNVATTVSLVSLMENALILGAKAGVDVFNCLDLLDNQQFIEELKFGRGDGNLHYYLFNLECPFLKPNEVGIVLL